MLYKNLNTQRLAIALCLVSIGIFFSCGKELSYTGETYTTVNPGTTLNIVLPDPITATLQGNIVDENGQPADGVTVTVGNSIVITDNKGFFRLTNASLDKNGALVKAQKSGYFQAIRTFCATSGTNQVNIKLIKKILAGTISSVSGGEISFGNGCKVALPPNPVVVASSNAVYNGNIHIYTAYIDPTADDIDQTIPGSFMAENKNGSRVFLQSFGMLAVELEGNSGEKLQIKSGSSAILTTAIPTTLQSKAPASIALWSIDESSGLWKEEGTAVKNGSLYTGEVSHFSFWNCDVAMTAAKITLKLQDKSALPIIGATVKLTSTPYNSLTSYGITDSLGVVSWFVPVNQRFTMDVLTGCKTAIFSQEIGPFTQDKILDPITLSGTAFANSFIKIQGNLINCSNTSVTNGYCVISYGNNSLWVSVDASGNFSTGMLHCPGAGFNSFQIYCVDHANKQQGSVVTVPINLPVTNVGTLTACGTNAAQFVYYTLDGISYTIVPTLSDTSGVITTQTGTGYQSNLNAFDGGKYINATFIHTTTTPGTYPINVSLTIAAGNGSWYIIPGNTGVNITFTKFAQNFGEFYEGTFSGTFVHGATPHTVTNGSFKLRKK